MANQVAILLYLCWGIAQCPVGGAGRAFTRDGRETVERWVQQPDTSSPPASACQVSIVNRLDCYPDSLTDEGKCAARNCCWSPVEGALRYRGIPWCFFPSSAGSGYSVTSRSQTPLGFSAVLQRSVPSHWPRDVMKLKLDVTYEAESRVHFKIYDPAVKRYEVPIDTPRVTSPTSHMDYAVTVTPSPFSIRVTRTASDTVLFDSSSTPLIFADQLLQIGTSLPTDSIYGLGEHRQPFMINASQPSRLAFWSRDQPPATNLNLYGDHAFFLGIEASGDAYGVFLLNSNAKEVALGNTDGLGLTYITIGGILDFYIFTGPSPDDVIQQYSRVIGHTFMPPYWSLGFHLCRWGYGSSAGLKKVVKRMRAANMPYDAQWTDIDYMDKHLDWTYDKTKYSTLPDVVADLHAHGQHYVIIVDPGISSTQPNGSYPPYDEGLRDGVFIMREDRTGPLIGKVWPGETAYPDFTNPQTPVWWERMAKSFHDVLPFDGLWTDMNEPSNFVFGSMNGCPPNNTYNTPPYTPGIASGKLPDRTVCPSANQYLSRHYNLHSMYGHFEGIATNRALVSIRQNRSLVISRSTFPGSGRYMGHWTGDNSADWDNLYYSIPAILSFNMFGIPLVGADICGFSGTTTEELCTRWMQLGAFYPFMRNHNAIGSKDQDPAVFGPSAQDSMRTALTTRYTLLPYLYTLFYHSHLTGSMVARPLFFEFPQDTNTYPIDKQFMWGNGLLISPVLEKGKTSVSAYFPRANWYELDSGNLVEGSGSSITLDAPLSKINVHVKGGLVIAFQKPEVTTTLSRLNLFGLLVALNESGSASGDLFWDDGDTVDTIETGQYNFIDFSVAQGKLTSSVVKAGYSSPAMSLGSVVVYGVQSQPVKVTVNSRSMPFQYDTANKALRVTGLSEDLLKPLRVSWSAG
ncbi:lysosomal alpha-glucosidase-like [Liolophura sinensis]|uniref:lysosomal alpha-glucosidase-like n=1 Tax=Liolophura sinensis TaxID=3198878 RepID=UPI003158B923